MANNNDNAVVRTDRNGVEYFTIVATGESGMSQRGLARACGKRLYTVQNLIETLTNGKAPKRLERFVGKNLTLTNEAVKNHKSVIVYRSDFCSAVIKHYSRLGSAKAQDFDDAIGEIGLTSYIQSVTGWLPEQYTAAPIAHEQVSRILDRPDPWKKLFDREFCQQVYALGGPNFYWDFCYHWLTPIERCEIELKNPVVNGRRHDRIHQFFSEATKKRLKPYLLELAAIVHTADGDRQAFLNGYRRHFNGIGQPTLF